MLSTQERGNEKEEDTIRKRVDAGNRHDINAMAMFYSSDVELHDPIFPQPLKGRENIKRFWEVTLKAFPDYHEEILSIISKAEKVAVEIVGTGTFTGTLEMLGGATIPPTGKRFEFRYATFIRFDHDGLIREARGYYDTAGLLKQLGVKL